MLAGEPTNARFSRPQEDPLHAEALACAAGEKISEASATVVWYSLLSIAIPM